jgi:hypothetical protein
MQKKWFRERMEKLYQAHVIGLHEEKLAYVLHTVLWFRIGGYMVVALFVLALVRVSSMDWLPHLGPRVRIPQLPTHLPVSICLACILILVLAISLKDWDMQLFNHFFHSRY